jgi:hypothetical protein
LRGFLRRELDFFIKNEGLLIDELVGGDQRDLGRHVQLGEILHQVAEAIIDFLAQVDGFRGNSGRRGSSYSAPNTAPVLTRCPKGYGTRWWQTGIR